MNTKHDYEVIKKGWVLIEEPTGAFFCGCDECGWFKTTGMLSAAYFFPSRAKAVAFVKEKELTRKPWLIAPAKVIDYIETTRAVRVKEGKMKKC